MRRVGISERLTILLAVIMALTMQTGDDSHAGIMMLIAAASLTVLASMGAARRRRSRQR